MYNHWEPAVEDLYPQSVMIPTCSSHTYLRFQPGGISLWESTLEEIHPEYTFHPDKHIDYNELRVLIPPVLLLEPLLAIFFAFQYE